MAAYAYEAITVADTAIGFTTTKITDSKALYGHDVKKVIATVETATIRFCCDGTTPTDTVGHLCYVGDVIHIDRADALRFKAIRTGSTSASLKATYQV